ncbi:MAG: hypothetical protein GTO46_04210 [Gemmatimonadetes bacterium]|nr:hypothetical protein [Gemmatimonadota bacterium]NIO30927.1 hypothetical protein [Gemmatimonadota bacterium]
MNTERLDLDANMERLVAALNGCPGIHTFSSCGGHPDPEPGHAPQGEFNVRFTVEPSAGGWLSLELILQACAEEAKLVAWWAAEDYLPGAVAFQLEGRGEATPDRIAEEIERAPS